MSIVNNINYVGEFVDFYLDNCINKGDTVVDTTVGKGNDTLKLVERVGPEGRIYGFDIQQVAIDKTREKIIKTGHISDNLVLIQDCHSKILDHIDEEIDLCIMNLGYLPGSDKKITTESNTTIKCIEGICSLLKPGGKLLITMYPGHSTGKSERDSILDYLSTVDQRQYNILHMNFVNQINNPPELIIMEGRYER